MDIVKTLSEIKKICAEHDDICNGCPFTDLKDMPCCIFAEIPAKWNDENLKEVEENLK